MTHRKYKDMIGRKTNMLTLISYVDGNSGVFRCDCGIDKTIRLSRVFLGTTKSCSCQGGKRASSKTVLEMGPSNNRSPEYNIWKAMHRRCTNKNSKNWSRYGGRGIKVCSRWTGSNGFSNFYNDMGKKPNGHSIERINNNGDYEPKNCRWATYSEQANNTSKTLFFDYNGELKTVTELSKLFNISRQRFHYLLRSRGYDYIKKNYDQSSSQ